MTRAGSIRPSLRLRDLLFLSAFTVLLFGSVASAHAAGNAVFSSLVPAPGSVVLTKPTQIVLTADDSAPVLSASIKVNGVSALTWLTNPVGHWVWDDNAESDVFIVDDPTVVTMGSYQTAWTMVNGTNTVVATVLSGSGVSTYSWTFQYVKDTSVTSVSPAPASVLPASPATITASLTSPYTAFTPSMKLDGVLVPTTYSAATKTFTYTPGAALQPGPHTVVFAATAAVGSGTKTWSFNVSPPMSSVWDCKSCHSTYPATHAKDVCAPCHSQVWSPAGQHGDAIPTVAGCMGPTANGACHVLDHSGYMGKGLVGFTCNECHSAAYPSVRRHTDDTVAAAHVGTSPGAFCDPCHGTALVTEHAKYPSAATVKYQCTICHGATARQQARDAVSAHDRRCGTCHATPHATQHANVSMTCAGPACHTGTDLTAVHSRIGCDGCHSSTRAEVVAAIAGHKKDCSACHNPMAVHGAVHNSNPDYSGPVAIPVNGANGGVVASGAVNLKCAGCHRVNLLADHGTDYNNCPMCHASGGPRASFVTWDKTCRTGACHPIVNGNTAAPHPAPTRAMDHQLVANGQVPTGYCQSCHGNPEMWQCGAPFGCHASTTGPVTSVDYRPPTTTPTRTGTDPIVWKLNAADIGDGVTATYYSFDGAPFALYTAADMSAGITNPADVSAPYTHTLRYYSVDAANNIEATVTTSYNVTDITPPVVTFNGLWLGGTSYVAKSLVMSVTDPRVRGLNTGVAFIHTDVLTFYRIYTYPYPTPFYQSMADFSYPSDGSWDATRDITGLEAYAIAKNQPGSWPTWSGGNSTTNGGFEIQYYARDYAGNQTPMLHASLSIDNAAPVTTVSVVTAGATWKLPASDNAAGVASTYYSFDGAPLATYTPADASAGISNTTPGGTALGDHSLSYYSVDRLGNTEVTKTYAYTIAETTPPQGALSSTMTSSTVSIIAWDPVGPLGSSGIKSVTGGLYTGGGTLVRSINTAFAAGDVTTRTVDVGTIPADGQYCVSFTIYDWAGNVSPWVGPQYFKVDTTAPTTLVHWQWDGTWQVSGDDGPYGSGVAATYYSFDGAPFQLLVGPATTPPALLTQPGVHTLRCYSVDKLGHVEAAPKSDSFTVK